MLLLFLGVSTMASAFSPKHLWEESNRFFNQKQYDSALVCFQQIEKTGAQNAALFFNIGNTYYRLDNTPLSVLYYEKALFLDPLNTQIKDNLSLAQARVQLPMTPVAPVFFISWWQDFIRLMPPTVWAWLMLICFVGGLCFVYRNVKKKNQIEFAGRWLSLFAVGFVLTGILFYYSFQARTYSNKAVIMIDNTPFFNHQKATTPTGQLPEGSVVKIRSEKEGWYDVSLPNGSRAWVSAKAIIKVID